MALDKTFDAAEAEKRLYAAWEKAGAFNAGANASRDETFSIMIPPPNVTGVLHMGHAFNNTLQDILIRWHRMRGFDTLWQPGQDHAGIATQMVVERKLAETQQPSRSEMGRDAFLEKVWEWKTESGNTIIDQLKRLGASCDWERNAFTMSGAPNAPAGEEGNFHDAVIKVFVEMYNKGLIYRGKRLVNWDPHFETAISDLEVENIEVDGHMWHFKYPLAGGATYTYVEKDEDGNVTLEEERDYISIATTRPETMLGDGAVAVHPSDERYAPIVGQLCEIPVGPKESRRLIPIITDEYPDKDFGSGAVKITGAHDFNDYEVAKRGNIPMYNLMDTKGAMRADGRPYAEEAAIAQRIAAGEEAFDVAKIAAMNLVPDAYRGMDRFEARKAVVADITAEGLAVMTDADDPRLGKPNKKKKQDEAEVEASPVPLVEAKKIMQPFGDRSKVVIEPMLTDQWFVDTAKIVGPAIDAVRNGDVQIMPEQDKKVYFHWLENIEPWCISRQLWWGHQIPVWFDADGKEYCAATEAEAQAMAPGKSLTRDPDVLDTWFSSGLWPIGTLGWPEQTEALDKYFPTSVLITGFDIIFFWVARMMMMQYAVVDQKPFDTVYVHALVRDEKGKKMSKSLGNVLDPLELIDEYGADAVRFTVTAMAAMGRDLKLSTARIAGYRNFGTKLWNAHRFAEMNGVFTGTQAEMPRPEATLNKWIVGECARIREEVDLALENFRFNDAANALYAFVWGKVCDWYVELSKPLLQDDAPEAAETRQTMGWVLDQCLILMHPIMPYITEELWQTTASRAKMLVHADWPTYSTTDLLDADADRELNWVIGLIESIRSARQQMHVPAGLKVPMLVTDLDAAGQAAWDRNEVMIKRLARVDSLEKTGDFPKGTVSIAVPGASFGLPLAGLIDIGEEKARLQKSLEKLAKEIGGLKGRLNNPKFAASAPEEVVAEAQANLDARQEEADQLQAALDRLAEME
ncbi:valine--tRNA ligase [Sulfitobacter mediterraneus]|uniref:valine--tRNA ligase n=1 Tax=Sulfitobacter mediterraneus TaxID=83219 RepID=UPI001931D3C5|nr:valine--tRNA ligase [Sulfitobacter mediterraneus]MBM1631373.1 valine--tRNA ligase [Sulfitobacter mediterraneus]MBM1639188.1 valine--tRNA ligase [Sulfitobacter mediterraneus]MBM1643237.1 valine--tRNA ligase [Sulfitobacter mediterraneus]MBM1647283.1 valine--tRNA ligase [Sulfitobacter mediterraneus]MBM1651328.1 valine--tRNA ligase [Sulfitobacter mediterraneus]